MKHGFVFAALILLFLLISCKSGKVPKTEWAIAIHGGAGNLTKEKLTPDKEALYRAALQQALDTGRAVLKRGGSSFIPALFRQQVMVSFLSVIQWRITFLHLLNIRVFPLTQLPALL
jgi:hypothetical protein